MSSVFQIKFLRVMLRNITIQNTKIHDKSQ